MAKRKSKKPQLDDTSILLESSEPKSRERIGSYASQALLFIFFTVGAAILGWFCVQQQYSFDELSESFTKMQMRITNLQQVMERTGSQTITGLNVEDRIFALEEAQKQTGEKAEVAMATSEMLQNSDLFSPFLALRDETDNQLAEMNQVSLSVTTLQAMFKNQSEEFEAVKESLTAGLSSSSALAENVAGLTSVLASAWSRVDERVVSVEAQLEGQASELDELKESMHLQNVALHTNSLEMASIKELIKAKQAVRAQALEEMLSAVKMTLDEQFFTSQTLHSSVMAQLHTFHTKLANAPLSMKVKSNEEGLTAEEFNSSPAQIATEEQETPGDVEEKDEQQDAVDEAEQEAKEEEEMQRELSVEQEVEGSVTEEQQEEEEEDVTVEEEEIAPEEVEDEESIGQSVDHEVAVVTVEETVDSHDLDEKQVSDEVVESRDPLEEAELNSEDLMDKNEE